MPELRADSPIMDGLIAGQCFTEHDGVHCYPAIRRETGEKYIIKVISVPATDAQVEAMLLAGAFESREAAKPYFQTLAQEVVTETKTLNSLSLLEGFVGCEQVYCEEMETGYQICILTPYRECAETMLKNEALTHAQALGLALDLCAALTACRRAGFMYIDLKPDNIFKNEQDVYCIGDIGFTALRSLKYASLPEKYRSSYTAPEMADCFAQLNDTLDVYALGLVLYQAYNGGELPFEGTAPAEAFPAPIYADYELAEIILTACDPDPVKRWADPAAMGQAIRAYMERNELGDAPIIPPPPAPEPEEEPEIEAVEEFLPDMADEELQQAMAEEVETPPAEEDELQLIAALAAEDSDIAVGNLDDQEETSDEETAQMLAQAEELMSLIPPEPVVAPEAVHVPDPAPIIEELKSETQAEAEQQEAPPLSVMDENPIPAEEAPAQAEAPKRSKLWGKLVAVLIVLILLGGAVGGGYYYYTEIYQQHIDAIQITGTDSTAVVTVLTDIDESLLTLLCIDGYGNSHPAKLVNGKATFENLNPQTRYTVTLRIDGFHQLVGQTEAHFITASRTEIQDFQATIGPVDGSVVLSFNFSGPEPTGWKIVATAPGQETLTQAFTGTAVTMDGLTVGCEYTFTLVPEGELYLSGQTQTTFTAVKLVFAQDPVIESCNGGKLTVTWSAPADAVVESWTLRCYNATGYDVTVTVTDTRYTFVDLDPSHPTTVEITAAGMIKSVSTSICANPVTVWDYPYTAQPYVGIDLGWNAEGKTPDGGWILHWSIDGVAQQPINTQENAVLLPLYVPGGVYEITLLAADDTYIFGNTFSFTLPELIEFNMHDLTSADLRIRPFRAHTGKIDWTKLNKKRFVGPFSLEDDVKILLDTEKTIADSNEEVVVQYILRNEDGSILSDTSKTMKWNSMWYKNGCVLSPELPETVGNYILSLYWNGMFVADIPISIV